MGSVSSFLESYAVRIDAFLKDENMVEIVVNPDGTVWIERQGDPHMSCVAGLRFSALESEDLAKSIASEIKIELSSKKPILSGKIVYKSRPLRAQVVIAPAVESGVSITLRSYTSRKLSLNDFGLLHGKLIDIQAERQGRVEKMKSLVEAGIIDDAMRMAVDDRLNILLSGSVQAGKTAFARSLLDLVPETERIITIEDSFELFPPQPNNVQLFSKREKDAPNSPAKLLESCLRMRPDRIMLGELRGSEVKTYLDALNTGHSGSFTTLHADSSKQAIDRLAMMVMDLGINMSMEDLKRHCALSIDVVVQLARHNGKRGIVEMYMPKAEIDEIAR